MKVGRKTPQLLHPDKRSWWVVMEGEIRFEMDKQEPFTAKLSSTDVVGDKPTVVFETKMGESHEGNKPHVTFDTKD